jgi:hypothetical protein
MNTPEDYVRMSIAKKYIANRLDQHETRRKIKQTKVKRRPSIFYCAICRALVNIGHVLVASGRRLERFDFVLRNSQT